MIGRSLVPSSKLAVMAISAATLVTATARADNGRLYGIHWWGYSGTPIDPTPGVLLDCPTYGGWDVETVLTHSASWWAAGNFVPLYADLYTNRNMSIITRIDYNWGETVPSPSSPDYAGWPTFVVGTVNTLRSYCHIWLIGNEPNILGEGTNWPDSKVTPAGYATIYRNVRNAIRNYAQASPAGAHLVLVAAPSPGGIIAGVRWMAGTDWLAEVIDNIPPEEIDGFALHAYGGTVADFHKGYTEQLAVIDGKGLWTRPVFITEWNRYATPGNATEEAAAAQLCRDAFADVNAWNQTPGTHNIVSMSWFVYDADQQASGGWNGYSIEYWKNAGNPAGHAGDLFTAFQQTVDLRYAAGAWGVPGNNLSLAAPAGSNLAGGATQVAADSVNTSGQSAAKAVDGFLETKWCSLPTTAEHWLKLDLGANRTVTGYIVRHAGAGGELAHYNTQQFSIQSGTSYNGPWTDEVVVNNSGQFPVSTRSYLTPKTLRYIRLYVTDAGIDTYARIPEFEVWGNPPPTAAFVGAPTTGRSPLEVGFTDQSTGQVSSWWWTFGDSGTSALRNPSHTYARPGVYTVSLTVTGPGGSTTATRTHYISVQAPTGDFDADGDVDMDDFSRFQMCFAGPNRPSLLPSQCGGQDLDGDSDVDLMDFSLFQTCFNGPNRPAAASCP